MNYDAIFLPSVARLSKLVRHRYGCEFVYEPMTQLARTAMAPLRSDLLKGEPVCAGDWVFFPIFIGDELAGAARVSNRDSFNKSDMVYLHQIIRLVLEASLNNVERLDILDQFETQMNNPEKPLNSRISRPHSLDRKIIPLVKRARGPEYPLPSSKEIASTLNFPFLIEGPSIEDVHKMALEIHHRTHRYAFLQMRFITETVFTDVNAILALGPITIFIEDISQLTSQQQSQIAAYYRHADRSKTSPQFIAGSVLPVNEVKRKRPEMQEFLNAVMIGYLCMNHPFEVYKRENLLDFFYDHLTGRHPV